MPFKLLKGKEGKDISFKHIAYKKLEDGFNKEIKQEISIEGQNFVNLQSFDPCIQLRFEPAIRQGQFEKCGEISGKDEKILC